jgi:hypothetical protein
MLSPIKKPSLWLVVCSHRKTIVARIGLSSKNNMPVYPMQFYSTILETLDLPIPSSENPTPEELEQVLAERERLIRECYVRYDKQLQDHLQCVEWKEKGLPIPEPICSRCDVSCHCFLTMQWLVDYNELKTTVFKTPIYYYEDSPSTPVGRPISHLQSSYLHRCDKCECGSRIS